MKPTPFSDEPNAGGVADQHDRQAIGLEIGARHALDIVDGHRVHAVAEVLQILDRQAVEHHVQHLHGDRVRRFDRQRKAAGHVRLGVGQLALADRLALQPPELVER